ncbi:MAG: terminase large subunit [Azospirillum sp.]|nr:terminase large subunit [Azospirillum sp.]
MGSDRRGRSSTSRTPARPPADPVTAWARAVVRGKIVAGPHVRNACRRHLQDLKEAKTRGLRWDRAAALKAIQFFPKFLTLSQGEFDRLPFALHPAQQFIVGSVFGWKRAATGKRRFRRVYIEIAKGSGKSPLAAGIALYCLLADGEAGAQIYSAASMKNQARVVFDFAIRMWQHGPARLRNALTPTGKLVVTNLAHLGSGSFFRPVSQEEGAKSGYMPHCTICDEVHEHRSPAVIRMNERGFKSRSQPLLIMITNSGSDRKSVCWEEHAHAVRVAAGTRTPDATFAYVGEAIDDAEFAFVCGLDPDEDPLEDEACWIKANPLLGVTFPYDELRRIVAQCRAIPGTLNESLRLHFCVWTDAETAWMSRAAMEACLAAFDPADAAGAMVYAGVDLSATRDLTAVAFVMPTGAVEVELPDGTRVARPTFDAWIEAWTPGDTVAERAIKDATPYDVWVREGFLQAPPGKHVAYDFIAYRLAEYAARFELKLLAYDAYAFKRLFEPELERAQVTVPLVSHPQGGTRRSTESGLWMPGSKTELETLFLDRRIRLKPNPVLESAIMGAALSAPDPVGNQYFSKQRATTRIDALVALAMAVGAATVAAGPEDKTSPYEERDLVVVG